MDKETRTSRILICQLTEDELKEESRKLTDLLLQKGRLEAEKKSVNQHYSERIKDIDEAIEEQIPIVQYNQKEKTIVFRVEFNSPEPGFKTLFKLDSGEIFEVEKMTESEIQDLFINSQEKNGSEDKAADICYMCGAINTLNGNKILHINHDKQICLVCLAEKNERNLKKVSDWEKSGHQVLFRPMFGFGCTPKNADTTCFRFMGAGHSWGLPVYKAGNYEVEGTDANLFYSALCNREIFKED